MEKDFDVTSLENGTGLTTRFAIKLNSNLFWGFNAKGTTEAGVCIFDSSTGGQLVVNDKNFLRIAEFLKND